MGCASLETFRIAEGIPAYGIDMVERDLPQETSQMRALHFNKGCYLGQEIVERIRSRGNVHRHLRPLELSGPVPASGTELTLEDGAVAGQITSAAELPLAEGKPRVRPGHGARGSRGARPAVPVHSRGRLEGTAEILAEPPSLARAGIVPRAAGAKRQSGRRQRHDGAARGEGEKLEP